MLTEVLRLLIAKAEMSPRARNAYLLSPQWAPLDGSWLIDLSDFADPADFFVALYCQVGQVPGRYRVRQQFRSGFGKVLGSVVYDDGELIGRGGYWWNRRCVLARYFAEREDRQFTKQVRGSVLQEKAALGLHLWEFPE